MPHGEVYHGCRGSRVSDSRAMLHCVVEITCGMFHSGDAVGVYHGVGHEGTLCGVCCESVIWGCDMKGVVGLCCGIHHGGCCGGMWWEQLYGSTVQMCHGSAVRRGPYCPERYLRSLVSATGHPRAHHQA